MNKTLPHQYQGSKRKQSNANAERAENLVKQYKELKKSGWERTDLTRGQLIQIIDYLLSKA